jgi:YegS/Rv2252/BmrU family lipid kinase
MRRTAVIVNGAAGGGRCAQRVDGLLERLRRSDELEVFRTEYVGHATELTREVVAGGYTDVIAAGGDGTVFEVVNGLFPSDKPSVRLGVLPLGTGNSLVRDFGLGEVGTAVTAITVGQARPVDVIRVCHDQGELYYLNLLSVGFSARAGALTNRRFKALGLSGYALSVVVSLARLHASAFPLRLDGGVKDERPCTLLSFSNSRFTGGDMMMAPSADVADGLVDVVRIGPMGRRRFLGCFPKIFKGTHPEMAETEVTLAGRVDFDLEEAVDVMVDGEILSLKLNSLEVLPGALEFIA